MASTLELNSHLNSNCFNVLQFNLENFSLHFVVPELPSEAVHLMLFQMICPLLPRSYCRLSIEPF